MRTRVLAEAVAILVLRFALMALVATAAAPLGWYAGLVVNVVLGAAAVLLVHHLRLWASLGGLRPSPHHRGDSTATALLWLVPFLVDIAVWVVPHGLRVRPPGLALWTVTLLLVGLNEELFVRGVILTRLQRAWSAPMAVTLSACLFGLQHLSNLVLTSRGTVDVLQNVVLSGIHGFAYAAFQVRWRWLWPLVVLHAVSDLSKVLPARPLSDPQIVIEHAALLGVGLLLLRSARRAT